MPHRPEPFFRTACNAWYVQLGKQQIELWPGPKTATTEKATWGRFYELMAAKPEPPKTSAEYAAGPSVAEVCDKFPDWTQKHRAKRTYDWYFEHVQGFLDSLPAADRPATDLRPFHVTE